MSSLEQYGWSEELTGHWVSDKGDQLIPARVVADFGTSLKVAIPEIIKAELSGKLAHHSSPEEVPKIGDWVGVRQYDTGSAIIEQVITRRNEIARRAPGNRTNKQIIAANVDVAFVILSLDKDFSVERLRRFLYQLSVSKIQAVIILNKSDKVDHLDNFTDQLTSFKIPLITASATEGDGVAEILSYIQPGQTAILLGSSGVGKSTLTNQLLGETIQRTQETRESDDTGKHTTVHRELFILPNGGLLIDTPGVRELQLWGSEAELDDNYDDIAAIARQCKYTTCQHGDEEGCAIRQALSDGALTKLRYEAYLKMKRELVQLEIKNVAKLRRDKRKPRRDERSYSDDEF